MAPTLHVEVEAHQPLNKKNEGIDDEVFLVWKASSLPQDVFCKQVWQLKAREQGVAETENIASNTTNKSGSGIFIDSPSLTCILVLEFVWL